MENKIITVRDVDTICAEINVIKKNTERFVLQSACEIGMRLKEAKEFVEHGEWQGWLENNVNYSVRTAQNLMRMHTEYADKLLILDEDSKTQPVAFLGYTAALELLSLPENEREKFIENNDVDDMSKRELQEAIKAKKEAITLQEKAIALQKEAEAEVEAKQKKIEGMQKTNDLLNDEIARLGDELSEAKNEDKAKELKAKIKELKEEQEKAVALAEKEIAKLQCEVKEQKAVADQLQTKVNQADNEDKAMFKIYFDEIVSKFSSLCDVAKNMEDADQKNKYIGAVQKLCSKLEDAVEGLIMASDME